MDRDEALGLLNAKLDDYRKMPYTELVSNIDSNQVIEIVGLSGVEYQIEIQVMWDHKPNGDIRVMGAIDDGGLRAVGPAVVAVLEYAGLVSRTERAALGGLQDVPILNTLPNEVGRVRAHVVGERERPEAGGEARGA